LNEYALIKLVHLGALIFWLGPPFGAWLVLKVVEKRGISQDPVAAKVSQMFFATIVLEHVAFIVLLGTGFTLAYRYQLWGAEWLSQKLFLVLMVIVPLELIDIVLGNWIARQAATKLYQGKVLRSWERRGLVFYHGIFTKLALVVIPISVIVIMYLAISKVGL